MEILPPFFSMSLNSLLFMVSLLIITVSCFTLHFIVQFSVLIQNNFPLGIIVFHYLGVVIGSSVYLSKFSMFNQNRFYIPYYAGLTFSLIFMVLSNNILIITIFMVSSGFFVGIVFIVTLQYFGFMFNNPIKDGKLFFWAMPTFSILLIIEAIISNTNKYIHGAYLLLLFFIGSFLFYITTKNSKYILFSRSSNKKLKYFYKRKENWTFFIFYFAVGIFFVSIYYSSFLLLNIQLYSEFVNFMIVVLASLIFLFLPIGNLFDLLGRKFSMALGILFHAVAYLLISILQILPIQSDSIFLGINIINLIEELIFPIFLSIGFSITIMGSVLYLIESEKTEEHIETAITGNGLLFVGSGSLFTVIVIEILKSGLLSDLFLLIVTNQLTLIPFLLFLAYVPFLIIIYFSKETKIPKEEKYWWKSTRYVFILNNEYEVEYKDRLWAFQEDEDYDSMLNVVKENLVKNKSIKNQYIHINSNYALSKFSENCILILITRLDLQILKRKLSLFINDFEAMGAIMKRDRLVELVHKYLIKQEYIEKIGSNLDQEDFGKYLDDIRRIGGNNS